MNLDISIDGVWHPCATINPATDGPAATRRSPVRLQYDADYATEHLNARDYRALTVRAPVDLGIRALPCWPSFLVDLLPQGAARRRIERLGDGAFTEWQLLERGAINPVGNLRVHPPNAVVQPKHNGFELSEMIPRGDAFVDFAYEVGATVAGATDTQGEAPKFWVVEDQQGRWHPDSGALGFPVRRYALLKFPVPEAGPRAAEILRHEAAYQRVAQRLGLRVTNSLPEFIDGALLIPRFDRRWENDAEVRLGVESLYSVAGVLNSTTTSLRHHDALVALASCTTDFDTEIVEYTRRDLLNLALGNRDNHGRNTAVLKETDGTMRLAPIYDCGPAFLDARAIVRVMHWDGEQPGRTDWSLVLDNLATRFEEAHVETRAWPALIESMQRFAEELNHLPAIMADCAVDKPIIDRRASEIERLKRELREIRLP
ncbi:MAG: HipA domain-containing protein [Gammaproteobacteria bacterium]